MKRRLVAALSASTLLASGLSMGAAQAAPSDRPSDTPDIAALAGDLAEQDLQWGDISTCDLDFSSLVTIIFGGLNIECADMTVPRDWDNPEDGETITVKLSRDPETVGTSGDFITMNPGGPGGPGLLYGAAFDLVYPDLAEHYNMVGFDPRGVGASTPYSCTTVKVDDDWEQGKNDAEGCYANELAPYLTTEQTAYDMDLMRHLMDSDELNYLGYSYGTWLGSWYQREFADNAGRFVLDSSVDLSEKSLQATWDLQPKSRDRAFQDLTMPYMARNSAELNVADDPIEVRKQFEEAGSVYVPKGRNAFSTWIVNAYRGNDHAGAQAIAQFINSNNVPSADEVKNAELDAAYRKVKQSENLTPEMEALLEQAYQEELDQRAAAEEGQSVYNSSGFFDTIRCQDGPWNKSKGYWESWDKRLSMKFPLIGEMTGIPACPHFEVQTEMPNVDPASYPDTLMLQSEFDVATPYEGAVASAQQNKAIRLVSVDNEIAHGLYPYGTECVDNAVTDWMVDGKLPEERFTACTGLPLGIEDEVYPAGDDVQSNGKIKTKLISKDSKEVLRWLRSNNQQPTDG